MASCSGGDRPALGLGKVVDSDMGEGKSLVEEDKPEDAVVGMMPEVAEHMAVDRRSMLLGCSPVVQEG